MELLLYTPLGETHIKDDSYYIQNDVAYVLMKLVNIFMGRQRHNQQL